MAMLPLKDAETSGFIYAPYIPVFTTHTTKTPNYSLGHPYYSVKYQDKTFEVEIANKKLGIYLKKKNTKKKKVILNINHDDKGIRQLCRFVLGLTTEGYSIPSETRRLNVTFSLDIAKNLTYMQNMNFYKEMEIALAKEIADEIDKELINKLKEQNE